MECGKAERKREVLIRDDLLNPTLNLSSLFSLSLISFLRALLFCLANSTLLPHRLPLSLSLSLPPPFSPPHLPTTTSAEPSLTATPLLISLIPKILLYYR